MLRRIFLPILFGIFLFVIAVIGDHNFLLNQELWWFDDVLHFIGGASAAWFLRTLFPQATIKQLLVLVLAIGIIWELAEWWGEYRAPIYWPLFATYMGIGSPFDTTTDLILDLLGGVTSLFALPKLWTPRVQKALLHKTSHK